MEDRKGEGADDQDGSCVASGFCHVISVPVMTWSQNFCSRDKVPLSRREGKTHASVRPISLVPDQSGLDESWSSWPFFP